MIIEIYQTGKRFTGDERWLVYRANCEPDGRLIVSQAFYDALIPEWKGSLTSGTPTN